MDPITFHGNSARCRLLAALARGGASEDFWRRFFASLDDLGSEDLEAVVLAVGAIKAPLAKWLGAPAAASTGLALQPVLTH